jgi:hypothetical protein
MMSEAIACLTAMRAERSLNPGITREGHSLE